MAHLVLEGRAYFFPAVTTQSGGRAWLRPLHAQKSQKMETERFRICLCVCGPLVCTSFLYVVRLRVCYVLYMCVYV